MTWEDALDEIHSTEFDVNLNVVSGTDHFFRAVAREPAVLDAFREMTQSGAAREDALGIISDLVHQETDLRFENPFDTPLAVLLWLTAFAADDYAKMAATLVNSAERCWYARKLAKRILNPPPADTTDYKFGDLSDETPMNESASSEMRFMIDPDTVFSLEPAIKSDSSDSSNLATTLKL